MKRIASIQDISCLGRCSLTVALPVVSAMGVECAVMPTAMLSTHTMFKDFICEDLSHLLLPVARHWKSEGVTFDALYTGYLASGEQVDEVLRCIELLSEPDTLLVVDPAMADHGKLYPAFGDAFPARMARLVSRADVALPNITEACLMTGLPYRETYDETYIRELLHAVSALGARYVVITGVSFAPDRLGVMAYDSRRDTFFSYFNARVPRAYHGTGDIFAATTVGGLMRGLTLEQSLTLAVDYTLHCIRLTRDDPRASWYGVEFERAIPLLTERLTAMERDGLLK